MAPQFVTATFMHANWQHLSSNAFSLLVFGRMVEVGSGRQTLGAPALLFAVPRLAWQRNACCATRQRGQDSKTSTKQDDCMSHSAGACHPLP